MIYLIVPCFNEANRLQLKDFKAAAKGDLHVVFADDGSRDNTAALIQDYINANAGVQLSLFRNPRNTGKAEAIRQAYLDLTKTRSLDERDWVGYWDADLATPLYEVSNMFSYNSTMYEGAADSVWGSRMYRLGSHIVRSAKRHYLGRLFATVIAVLLKAESYDSQCGAKLFNRTSAAVAFKDPFISRWIFDVEILLRLKNFKIIEYPLREWIDVPGSKVKILKESIRIWTDILKIRRKYLS